MSSDGATPLIFLAPPCPDCGQPCRHPLTMPTQSFTCSCGNYWDALDDGEEDDGTCTCCGDTCTAVFRQPPPPTDEQIFGRYCNECCWGDRCDTPGHADRSRKPPCCNGTGRTGAAQNLWTCPGGAPTCKCLCHSPMFSSNPIPASVREAMKRGERPLPDPDPRGTGDPCHRCPHVLEREGRYPLCPGRTDVVASPEAWEAFVRQLRTRTKTTVLNGMHEDGLVLNRTFHLVDYAPEDALAKQGKWTVTVTFEPKAAS